MAALLLLKVCRPVVWPWAELTIKQGSRAHKTGCGLQTKLAELQAKCLSYTLSLRRAEQQQAADKSMIASLSQSCSKLRAEVGLTIHSQHPIACSGVQAGVLNPHEGRHQHGQGCHECLTGIRPWWWSALSCRQGVVSMPEPPCSAQVKSFSAENSGMQARMQGILDAQKMRTVEVVRAAERARAQMLCEKAAAEHDLVQACPSCLPSPCLALCP